MRFLAIKLSNEKTITPDNNQTEKQSSEKENRKEFVKKEYLFDNKKLELVFNELSEYSEVTEEDLLVEVTALYLI